MTKRKLYLLCILFIAIPGSFAFGQSAIPHYPDSLFSTYYHQRATHFKTLPRTKNDIIFVGNSITDGGNWSELFGDIHIKNRGISGDVTKGVLNRLGEIVNRKPAKVFLLIGTNDLAHGVPPDSVIHHIFRIVSLIHQYSPATKMYVQSIFPVNDHFNKFPEHVNKGKDIKYINSHLAQAADSVHYIFIDLYDVLRNKENKMNLNYTNDGLHLLGPGYMVWKHVVYPYVYGLEQKPSLVPKPQSLHWTNTKFPLYKCRTIAVTDTSLTAEGRELQSILKNTGRPASLHQKVGKDEKTFIRLELGNVKVPIHKKEAYDIRVTANKIVITGNTPHGVFNGIQTLRQLMRDHVFVPGVHITDWPAFSWRGYMVDVGRNYQSIKQLKQQIDMMAHYKLNIFHLHLTENIAWRLQIKHYPQLTKASNMKRDEGQFYTIRDMKELIKYCRKRFITFIPEIDMPGHSGAFTRAFGVNMQSKNGLNIIKNILTEIDTTYQHLPYIHIGADEVKIKNKHFIPEVVGLLQNQGKQTIGWDPGGNYGQSTIHQLWTGQSQIKNPKVKYIDSRGLYLNHMDLEAGVSRIFGNKLCGVKFGDKHKLGGEICLWNDRRVANEKDLLRQNPAYPAMLAFAERSWQGGGFSGMKAAIGKPGSKQFKAFKKFEERLIDQKKEFFRKLPFPYVRQSNIKWKLFGPFNNGGNLQSSFWPEKENVSLADSTANKIATGGTIILRHWFSPAITGWLSHPKKNTTWYGYMKFWSNIDTTGLLWIGFNNPSRSYATNDPKAGTWDSQKSHIWLNGKMIPPPNWQHPGRRGNLESPLTDEGYYYRTPAKVHFNKGWNTVLVKAPTGSFKRNAYWQNPAKWRFTVIPVRKGSGKNRITSARRLPCFPKLNI
jgi:lysophospholipase L1-like esterase